MRAAVIGCGHVGATSAYLLARKGVSVTLVDIIEGLPQGTALDMLQSFPLLKTEADLKGTNDFSDIAGADLVVLTAGEARRPGMSRADLLARNARIVSSIVDETQKYAPSALMMIVTNPLDVMTFLVLRRSGLPGGRVFGMGGALDSSRMSYFTAEVLGVPVEEVSAIVVGSHGDSMVPLPRFTLVRGIPLVDVAESREIAEIVSRTRGAGAEIVSYLKRGSAFYAPAAAVAEMAESVLRDEKQVFSSCVFLEGQYRLSDLCLSVPVQLGAQGVEKIIELDLNQEERDALLKSAEEVREGIAELKKLYPDL
jgi:malate dehydrogenase